MTQQRAVDIHDGIAMIVTDLHGDWAAYARLRDRFLLLRAAGKAQRLVICGDVIHGYGDASDDASLEIVLDLMRLQAELGADAIIVLLGNHELPHIYDVTLLKDDLPMTPRFEAALMALDADMARPQSRADVITFLMRLPFFVRTRSGVLVTHAGAPTHIKKPEVLEHVLDFEHHKLVQLADEMMAEGYRLDDLRRSQQYRQYVADHFAVTDPDHPRFLAGMRGQLVGKMSQDFRLLWDMLFATNEIGSSLDVYRVFVAHFLEIMSALSPFALNWLVSGHIGVTGGHAWIGDQKLRLASSAHARPREAGQYLLLDCAAPLPSRAAMEAGLRSTFADD